MGCWARARSCPAEEERGRGAAPPRVEPATGEFHRLGKRARPGPLRGSCGGANSSRPDGCSRASVPTPTPRRADCAAAPGPAGGPHPDRRRESSVRGAQLTARPREREAPAGWAAGGAGPARSGRSARGQPRRWTPRRLRPAGAPPGRAPGPGPPSGSARQGGGGGEGAGPGPREGRSRAREKSTPRPSGPGEWTPSASASPGALTPALPAAASGSDAARPRPDCTTGSNSERDAHGGPAWVHLSPAPPVASTLYPKGTGELATLGLLKVNRGEVFLPQKKTSVCLSLNYFLLLV